MPRIKYTRTVYNYHFKIPPVTSELEFLSYKQMVTLDPGVSIIMATGTNKKNELIYILVVIGAISLLIGLIACLTQPNGVDAPTWGIFLLFLGILLLSITITSGALKSANNEADADKDRTEYYNELKRIVIASRNYSDFTTQYEETFRQV